jgi:hypothetical protein
MPIVSHNIRIVNIYFEIINEHVYFFGDKHVVDKGFYEHDLYL